MSANIINSPLDLCTIDISYCPVLWSFHSPFSFFLSFGEPAPVKAPVPILSSRTDS